MYHVEFADEVGKIHRIPAHRLNEALRIAKDTLVFDGDRARIVDPRSNKAVWSAERVGENVLEYIGA